MNLVIPGIITIFASAITGLLLKKINNLKKQLLAKDLKLKELSALVEKSVEVEAILQTIDDGVIITDFADKIVLVSKKAASILKTDILSLQNKDIKTILPASQLKEKINTPLTVNLPIQNGETIPTELKTLPVINQGVIQGNIYTLHDKTKEVQFEEIKSDFLAYGAHQLRTPITSIQGYLYMLTKTISPKLDQNENRLLNRAKASVDRLNILVESLIETMGISSGSIKLNLNLGSLEQLINESIYEHQTLASQKNITISFDKPTSPIPLVMIDTTLILSVLDNLIQNAIEHSNTDKIIIRLHKESDHLGVDVQDFGRGIQSDSANQLFTRFFRVPNNLIHQTQGNGIGLYIARKIIEAHRGKIWVNTLVGKGSTFSFTLPLQTKTSL